MNGFCVECGISTDRTVNGLCMDCFLKDRSLVSLPDHVDLFVCTSCGQFLWRGEYQPMAFEKALSMAARSALGVIREARLVECTADISPRDEYNYSVTLRCRLSISDFEADALASTIVRVKNSVCKICSRRTGNYYESILQIRTSAKAIPADLMDEVLARVERVVDNAAATNPNAFVTKMELVPGGVDVYLSLIALGRELSKTLSDLYCAETDESSKLVGQSRDGIDMYRVSYLVRLPDFHVGDVVRYGKKYYLLTRVSNSGGKIRSLSNFSEATVRRPNMPDLKVYAKESDLESADVISRASGEVQILDPADYSVRDLLVPKGESVGDTVKIVRIDGVLYYVPE